MSETFNYESICMGLTTEKTLANPQEMLKNDARLKFLIQSVNLTKGRILDVGCGGGSLTECLTYFYPSANIYGIDISRSAIKQARKNGKGKVVYAQITNGKFPFKTNYFDLVLCFDVLEHVPNVDRFIEEIKRVLKKDGLFCLAVPCEGQPFTFTWLFQKLHFGDKLTFKHFGHIHPEFTHKYVLNFLKKYNLTLIKQSYTDHIVYQLSVLIEYFLAKELLERYLGLKGAKRYYDRSIINSTPDNNKSRDKFMYLRLVWLKFWHYMGIVIRLERNIFKNIKFGSWKLLLLSKNIK